MTTTLSPNTSTTEQLTAAGGRRAGPLRCRPEPTGRPRPYGGALTDHRRRGRRGPDGRQRRRRAGDHRRPRGVPDLADGAGTGARRAGQAARPAAHRAQERPGRPDRGRGRQDPLRGAGRGPGDDRHLRLRRRRVAPARRPDHAVRAARAPADGDLAPARRRRGHLRVQLPRRGLGVEHRARAGLRRHRDLEAVGDHPAGRDRGLRAAGPGRRRARRTREPQHGRGHRRRRCGAAGRQPAGARWSARPGRSAWAPRSPPGSPPGSVGPSSSSAATTPRSSPRRADLDLAVRGIVFAAAGTAGQRCTTPAPADRARVARRHRGGPGGRRLPRPCRSATRSPTRSWSDR